MFLGSKVPHEINLFRPPVTGWLQGTLDGRSGLFPMEYVVPIGRSEARNAAKERVNHVSRSGRVGVGGGGVFFGCCERVF